MTIDIVPFTEEHLGLALAFNARLRHWGIPPEFELPPTPTPTWLPPGDGRGVFNNIFLALEDNTVRGVYLLKQEQFSFRGARRWVGCCHHPFSEGTVNKAYALLGVQMLRHALRIQPLLYALTIDRPDQHLAKMLIGMRWTHCEWSFYFKVLNAERFFTNLPAFQTTGFRRIAASLLAATRAGALAITTLQRFSGIRPRETNVSLEIVDEFTDWTEQVWRNCQPYYAIVPVRDCSTLRILYPQRNPRLVRLRVRKGSATVGWAVVADLKYRNSPYYGNLHVGSIVDVLAKPDDAACVVECAMVALNQRGADMVVTNQSHTSWVNAVKKSGFITGPPTFTFAASSGLAALLAPFPHSFATVHLTRSNADGLMKFEDCCASQYNDAC